MREEGREERSGGAGPPWLQAEVQMLPASLCSSCRRVVFGK